MYNPYQRAFYDRLTDESCIFAWFGTRVEKPGVWKTILMHGPVHLLCFLFTVLFFTFGIGYQTITFFLLPAIITIVLYSRMVPSFWFILLLMWPAMTLGTFFAYAGALSETDSPWQSPDTVLMLPVAAFFAALITVALCLDRSIAIYAYFILPFVEIFFGFPMVWAGLWSLMNRVSPFGRIGNWGYAVALMGIDNFTMGVTWSVGGVAGGAYAFAVIVSAFCYLSRRYVEVYHADRIETLAGQARPAPFLVAPKKHVESFFFHPVMFIFYFAMLFYGFGSIYQPFGPAPQAFYQRPISQFMPPTVQVSCVVNASVESTTNHLLTTGSGSKVVLWSEGSVTVNNDTALIEAGKVISQRFGVYLGMAYNLRIAKTGTYEYQNMFTLIVPPGVETNNGTTAMVAIRYQKANPLALIESVSQPTQIPEKQNFPFVKTSFGKMGVLFETDAVFNALISAYENGVVLMLQPARTFGPNGILDAQLSRITALEYGLSQFRCVEGGISTVNDPFYHTLAQQPTLNSGDSFAFKVPVYPQQWTMYMFLPDYLGIMTMAFFLLWIVLLLGFWIMRIRQRYAPKKWAFEPVPLELPFTD